MRMDNFVAKYLEKNNFERFEPMVALFDMDGVLYDSMWNHAQSWHESMAHYDIPMTEMDAFRYEGMRGVETIRLVTRQHRGQAVSEKEAEEMYKYKTECYRKKKTAPMIPSVHQLQENLHNKGIKIGVVTGSGQASLIDRILHDFDGLVSPEMIVTAHDVKHGKPAADPYLMGMDKATRVLQAEGRMGMTDCVKPYQTIVFENAPLGVKAAVAARCLTVAVNTGPLPDDILWEAGADVVVKTMQDAIDLLPIMTL